MDWAIQAAKKKNKRLPGGSRSIIESLNEFNDVVTDGNLEINRILNETGRWVKDIGNGFQGQLSPEKTVKISPETVVNSVPEEKTPERNVSLPSATPKSLAEPEPEREDEGEPEPEPEQEPEQELEPEPVSKPVSKPNPEPAPLPQHQEEPFARRRTTTRRSNVFVPLPSKDPLVVQPAPPQPSAEPIAAPPVAPPVAAPPVAAPPVAQSIAPPHVAPPHLPPTIPPVSAQTSTALSSPASNASPIASATSNSHRRRRPIATSSAANKPNVFDRLSSIPTKSFENKVNRTVRKGSSASSIDVTGSPMRRSSPIRNPGAVVDPSIQETLKTIFSTKSSGSRNASKVTKRNSPISHLAPSFNRRLRSSAAKPLTRESPTPVLHRELQRSQPPQPQYQFQRQIQRQPQHQFHRQPESQHQPKHQPEHQPQPQSRPQLQPQLQPQQQPQPQQPQPQPQQQRQQVDAPYPTRQKYDRLTKFQLLPPMESEKDDLKKKLNKRLSEVVRTQQDQYKRKHEQQKRKSHLEEDFKRRTKLWSDAATNTINTNKNAGSTPLQQLDKNNSILHDLYLADHRTILGESNSARSVGITAAGPGSNTGGPTGAGNQDDYADQSLPYIHSDSEEEDDVALAPWARSPYLQRQLYLQQNWDPRKIFGPIPPLHIDQIFQHSRLNRFKPKRG